MTGQQVLNALVVGGRGVGAVHAAALGHVPGATVAALAGSTPASARAAAERLGIPRWSHDYRDVVADPSIDVVHVCTPNDRHLPVVRDALAAGKHVVCEKPVAATVEDAAEMVRLARGAGGQALLCYKYRYLPLLQRLRELVADGSLGRPHAVRGHYLQSWKLSVDTADWRHDPRRAGFSPVLLDIGTHLIDLVEHALGARATSPFARIDPGPDGLPQANVLFRAGDALGSMTVSQVSPAGDNHLMLVIDGAEATATWTFDDRESLLLTRRADSTRLLTGTVSNPRRVATAGWDSSEDPLTSTVALFRALYEHIRSPSPDRRPPDLSDGLRHLRFFDAACASADPDRTPRETTGDPGPSEAMPSRS